MSTSASLDTTSLVVEPGSTGSTELQVHNAGQTVESYRLEPIGPDAQWLSIEPAELSLYPGTSGTAVLTVAPPRNSEALAGERPFGVRVVPVDHPNDMVAPEATLVVLPFADLGGELLPRTSTGISRGRHRLAIDNRGNAAVELSLRGQSETEQVRLGVVPDALLVPAGEAVFARVRVRPVRRVWRGTGPTHPFKMVATAPGGETVTVDGGYQQQPVLPSWVPRAIATAVIAALLLVGVWFTLMRPAVNSTAQKAADQVTQKKVDDALESRGIPKPAAGGGQKPSSAGQQPGGGGQGTSSPTANPTTTSPRRATPAGVSRAATNQRLEIRDAPDGASSEARYVVPAQRLLEVTDIFVQNPQGDSGNLTISAAGRPILLAALENFRDDPYYFRTPIEIPPGSTLIVTVSCRQPGTPVGAAKAARCLESVLINGTLRTVPPPAAPN